MLLNDKTPAGDELHGWHCSLECDVKYAIRETFLLSFTVIKQKDGFFPPFKGRKSIKSDTIMAALIKLS